MPPGPSELIMTFAGALRLWLRERDLDRVSTWFGRYGPRAVLIGRLNSG